VTIAVQNGLRIKCDGCGFKSAWMRRGSSRSADDAMDDPRFDKWGFGNGRHLCPLCVRYEKQGGKLVAEVGT